MKVYLFGRNANESQISIIERLIKLLSDAGDEISIDADFQGILNGMTSMAQSLIPVSSTGELRDFAPDLAMALGGDGTMLYAATMIKDTGIPIVGINLGRLGFLASVEQKHLEQAIDELRVGRYNVHKRSLISLNSNMPLFGDINFALNDFTVLKRDNSSMIIIHTFLDGEFLNSYWADGLIVSTPTGSTGYSLSCGGPIVFPESRSLVITPVAPHNLNVRPIVVPDEIEISFKVEGRTDSFLCTLDSRSEAITSAHELSVRKCDFYLNLIQLENMSFARTMRNKLLWGRDKRKFS